MLTETLVARRTITYLQQAEDSEALWTLACRMIYLSSLTLRENKRGGGEKCDHLVVATHTPATHIPRPVFL